MIMEQVPERLKDIFIHIIHLSFEEEPPYDELVELFQQMNELRMYAF